jgi:hypothetical protein
MKTLLDNQLRVVVRSEISINAKIGVKVSLIFKYLSILVSHCRCEKYSKIVTPSHKLLAYTSQ